MGTALGPRRGLADRRNVVMIMTDDNYRRGPFIAKARREALEGRERSIQDMADYEKTHDFSAPDPLKRWAEGMPPKDPMPKPEQKLDTPPVHVATKAQLDAVAAELEAVSKRVNRLNEAVRDHLVEGVRQAAEDSERRFNKQDLAVAQMEARLSHQILRALTPATSTPAPAVEDLPNPLQGRSSSRVN
jgi:hypothetical protein